MRNVMKTWFIYKTPLSGRWHVKNAQQRGDMTVEVVEKKHLDNAVAEIEKLKAQLLSLKEGAK